MAAQTTISNQLDRPFPGVLGDNAPPRISPKVSCEASTEIPHGHAVVRDTVNTETGVKLPHTDAATSAPLFVGVVIHTHANALEQTVGDIGVKPKATLDVLDFGSIWVSPTEAVKPGDPVRFQTTGPNIGRFLTTASATETVDISNMGRWVDVGDETKPCRLEINMISTGQAVADT